MDHATLTDNNGRKADFRQVVLIMTSNAGSREMSAGSIGFTDAAGERGLDNAPARRAGPFEGRHRAGLQPRVPQPPRRDRQLQAAHAGRDGDDRRQVHHPARGAARGTAHRHHAAADAPAISPTKGYDPIFGARPLARVIQAEVRDRLTDEILFGALENGGTVTIGYDGETLQFTFEAKLPQRNETVS